MSQKFGSFQGTGNTKYLNYNGSVTSGDIWFDHSNSAIKIYNGTSWDEVGLAFVGIDDNATSTAITIDSNERVGIGMSANSGCLLNVNDHIRAENSAFLAGRETAALPAFAFHDDTDTGMFNVASNILAFSTAGTERMRITSAGNIEVSGDFSSTVSGYDGNGDLSTNIGATISATTSGTLINNFFTADLIFSTNGGNSTATERMRIDSSGNVGIGTGSPGRLLTVSDSGGTLLSLVSTDDDNCQILFGDSVSDTVGKIVYAHGDNHMRLETNGAEAMRIASDGNVGIGETSPSFPLEVNGGTGDGIKIKAGNTANDDSFLVANSSDTALFKVDGAGNVGINTTSPDGTFHVKDAIAQVYIQSNDGQPSQVVFGDVSDASGGMIEYTSSNEMAFKTNNLNEAMRIASNGWVNPNANTTSNPADSQGLHFGWNLSNGGGESLIVFNQGAGATGGLVFSDNSANGTPVERMRINSSGNVGIGTSSPSELLEVNSTGSSAAIEVSAGEASTTTGEAKLVLRSLHSSSGTTYSRSEIASLGVAGGDSDLIFRTTTASAGPVEHMRIDANGNVGIGLPSAVARLEAQGSGTTSSTYSFITRDGNGQARFYIKDDGVSVFDGNVGIGTASPGTTLDVKGSARIERDGSSALLQFTDTGVSSRWIGMVDGTSRFAIYGTNGSTEEFVIDSSGRVGIGTTDPNELLTLQSAAAGLTSTINLRHTDSSSHTRGGTIVYNVNNGTSQTNAVFLQGFKTGNTSGGIFTVSTADTSWSAPTERMRIDSSGNVLVGKTTTSLATAGVALLPGGEIYVTRDSGATAYFNREGSDGDVIVIRNDNVTVGSISVSGSTTSYNPSSDVRLKENIRDYDNALADVMKLKPRKYSWKADGAEDSGFIAQELMETPEFANRVNPIDDDADDPMYGVDYMKFVAVLTGAIQEQQAMIEELKAEVAALKGE